MCDNLSDYSDSGLSYPLNTFEVKAGASNLTVGINPPYTSADFNVFFPQFAGQQINDRVMATFINEANVCIQKERWQTQWEYAMGLYIAHYLTLYLQRLAANPIASGQAKGVATSKSVGDVSVSYDVSVATDPVWGDFNLTSYGQELIRKGKLVGKGGMCVW